VGKNNSGMGDAPHFCVEMLRDPERSENIDPIGNKRDIPHRENSPVQWQLCSSLQESLGGRLGKQKTQPTGSRRKRSYEDNFMSLGPM
jgi:hypothetical protein